MENEKITEMLKEDEVVLWTGKPAPFKTFGSDFRMTVLQTFLLYALVSGVLIVLYHFFGGADDERTMRLSYIATAGIPAVMMVFSLFTYRSFRKKCTYCVTNQSIIGYISGEATMRFPLSDVDKLNSISQNADTRSILVGSASAFKRNRTRDYAIRPFYLEPEEGRSDIRYCVLYNLPESDANKVLDLIRANSAVA